MEDISQHAEPPKPGFVRHYGRLVLLLVVGLVLTGAISGYLHLTYSRPVGSGPAGPVWSFGSAFDRPWTKRPVLVAGLGDSVTAGFGARKGYSYFDRLIKTPADEFEELRRGCLSLVFPNLRCTNLSVSGSTSFDCVRSQLPLLPQQNPQTLGFVLITTGGNDLMHNYGRTPPREQAMFGATWEQAQPWLQGFQRRLEAILTGVSSRFPGGCHIFLANIYDPTDGVGDIEKAGLPAWPDGSRILEMYNEIISDCAARHTNTHLVNIHDLFLGHGIHCGQFWSEHYDSSDPHYWYHTNLEDPNERGYDAIRRLFLIEMEKVSRQLQ